MDWSTSSTNPAGINRSREVPVLLVGCLINIKLGEKECGLLLYPFELDKQVVFVHWGNSVFVLKRERSEDRVPNGCKKLIAQSARVGGLRLGAFHIQYLQLPRLSAVFTIALGCGLMILCALYSLVKMIFIQSKRWKKSVAFSHSYLCG